MPYNCTPPYTPKPNMCWNPDKGEKFWGFVTALVSLDDLHRGNDSRLELLKDKDLLYRCVSFFLCFLCFSV